MPPVIRAIAAVAAAAFLRAPTARRLVLGLVVGIGGLGIVLPQILAFEAPAGSVPGFLWALAAAACTGCGTVVAARNQRAGLPVAAIMGWSALAGSGLAFAWGIAAGGELLPAVTLPYLAGLLYLAILASCATFAMYFALVRRVGPAAASYVLSAVPIVATGIFFAPSLIRGDGALRLRLRSDAGAATEFVSGLPWIPRRALGRRPRGPRVEFPAMRSRRASLTRSRPCKGTRRRDPTNDGLRSTAGRVVRRAAATRTPRPIRHPPPLSPARNVSARRRSA